MTTAYTSILKLALPVTGELDGTWGTTVNSEITSMIEEAIAGKASISSWTGASHTLTTANGATSESRCAMLECSGAPGAAATVICPTATKIYILKNGVTGGYAVTLKTSGGTGIAVPNGKAMILYCDGTNVVDAVTHLSSLTLGSPLAVASGGSGAATLTGVLKGNGTSAFSEATAGTDFVAPGTATNFTAKQTFTGAANTLAAKLINALEKVTVSATAATGTINYDITTQSVLYYTTNASANWTVNFRGDGSNSLDSLMATGESVTVAFLVTQGATAYYNSAVQVDGSSVTPKWQGGTAPTSGNASSIDTYAYTIIKTGSATFTVLASRTQFK